MTFRLVTSETRLPSVLGPTKSCDCIRDPTSHRTQPHSLGSTLWRILHQHCCHKQQLLLLIVAIMEEQLKILGKRLRSNDPRLRHLYPKVHAGITPIVDNEEIYEIFAGALKGCRGNTHVHQVTLANLPEPELYVAVDQIADLENLEDLLVDDRHQSLPAPLVTRLFQCRSLRRVHLKTRLTFITQAQVNRFALALSGLASLEELSLHLLPRCSTHTPNLSFDPILLACASLPCLARLHCKAGYAHNPYGRPLVQANSLAFLVQSSALFDLQLENFGLRDAHVEALSFSSSLTALKLGQQNPGVTLDGWRALHEGLQDQLLDWEGDDESLRIRVQLNQLGFARLLKHTTSMEVWTVALAHAPSLDVVYALLQAHPTLMQREQQVRLEI